MFLLNRPDTFSSEQMWDGYSLSCVLPSVAAVSVMNAIVPCGVYLGPRSWGFLFWTPRGEIANTSLQQMDFHAE